MYLGCHAFTSAVRKIKNAMSRDSALGSITLKNLSSLSFTLDVAMFCIAFVPMDHFAKWEGCSFKLTTSRALQPNLRAAALVNQPVSFFQSSQLLPQFEALLNSCRPVTSEVTCDRFYECETGISRLVAQSLALHVTSIVKKAASTVTGTAST